MIRGPLSMTVQSIYPRNSSKTTCCLTATSSSQEAVRTKVLTEASI